MLGQCLGVGLPVVSVIGGSWSSGSQSINFSSRLQIPTDKTYAGRGGSMCKKCLISLLWGESAPHARLMRRSKPAIRRSGAGRFFGPSLRAGTPSLATAASRNDRIDPAHLKTSSQISEPQTVRPADRAIASIDRAGGH